MASYSVDVRNVAIWIEPCIIYGCFLDLVENRCVHYFLISTSYSTLQRGWTSGSDGFFYFQMEPKTTDEVIPAKMLAERTIEYARELEMIV